MGELVKQVRMGAWWSNELIGMVVMLPLAYLGSDGPTRNSPHPWAIDATPWGYDAATAKNHWRIARLIEPEFIDGTKLRDRNGVNVCGEAWHLGRRNAARSAEAAESLLQGTVAHRRIGARADRLRAIELCRRLVILGILGLAAILLVQLFSAGRLTLPW